MFTMNATGSGWWANIASGNGLMPAITETSVIPRLWLHHSNPTKSWRRDSFPKTKTRTVGNYIFMAYWLHSSAIAVPSKNYDLETTFLRNILKTTWSVSLCKAVWFWFVYFLVWHDDVIKWKHFPRYWPFVRGISRSPVNSRHKGQWRGALMFSMICALNKRLSKQSRSWWFETPSHSLWRRCNATTIQWFN